MSKQFERGPWRAVNNGRRTVYTDGATIVSAEYADEMAELTRMTDAECAAEYWRAKCEWVTAQEYAEVVVWHRFATRPHAHDPH